MSKKIKVLIVDDEPPARKGLRKMLSRDRGIIIVGECEDGIAALETISAKKPDVVFLDIQMPVLTGMEVASQLQTASHQPFIVFVTAYDKYAVRAFELNAFSYLLKPIESKKVATVVDRVKRSLLKDSEVAVNKRLVSLLRTLGGDQKVMPQWKKNEGRQLHDRIIIKTHGGLSFVPIEDIDWIEATGDYVTLHGKTGTYIMRETMSKMESRLDPQKFFRIHRSTIINLNRIKELKPLFAGDYTVILVDGTKLVLTRRHRPKLDFLIENK